VLPLALGQLVSWGSLYYAFAVISGPMGAELGWSKPAVNGALSLGLACTGLASFAAGRIIDRFGGRLLMTAGSVAAVVLLLSWSTVTALWQLYAVWALLGAVFSTVLYEPVFAVVARELGDNYRRGIVVITLLGGLASTVFIPLTHGLVESLGWRQALMVLALLQLPFGVLLHWLVVPGGASAAPAAPLVAARGRVGRAIRTPVFWLLAVSYAAHAFMFTTVSFHILPLLAERHFTVTAAVAAYTMVGPSQVTGRIIVYALERFVGVSYAGLVATFLPAVGMVCLLLATPGSPLLTAFAILYGTGMGIKTIVQATAAPEFLGREGYGALQGTFAGINFAVQAATPFATSLLWQVSGGYGPVLWLLLAITVLSALAFGSAVWLNAVRRVRA
jgi:MFS family permease